MVATNGSPSRHAGRQNISLAYPHFVAGTASSGQVCCATLGREVYTWGKPDGAFDSDRLRPKTFLWGATTVTDLMAFDTAISTKALTENRLVCVCVACCVLGVKAPGLSIFRAKTITQNRTGRRQVVYMPFRRQTAARRHIQHFYLSITFHCTQQRQQSFEPIFTQNRNNDYGTQ